MDTQAPVLTTFKSLVEHYRQKEMRMDHHSKKAYSTKARTGFRCPNGLAKT
jgi:hypothetical protein